MGFISEEKTTINIWNFDDTLLCASCELQTNVHFALLYICAFVPNYLAFELNYLHLPWISRCGNYW